MKYRTILTCAVVAMIVLLVAPAITQGATNTDTVGVRGKKTKLKDSSARSTVESKVVESAHPYKNNFDYTWTIKKSGASWIRVHFTKIETEKNYDFVYVYDYAGKTLHKLSGTYSSGGWTAKSYGDTIYVRLKTDSSVTKWGFKIDKIEYEGSSGGGSGGGGSGDGVTRYWAVIAGISDYKAISDLSYCDEDATDWYYHLVNNLGWSSSRIKVYGDGHSSHYPKYDGKATEYNIKQALNWLVSSADADDVIVYITSGHGNGNGYGSSYLCMWDDNAGENGEDGSLYDYELAAILRNAVAKKIFVFLDHCFSGGFGDDLMSMPNKANVFLTTTCTENGYGYDDPDHRNGAWTYYFLQYSWQNRYGGSANTALETVFSYALNAYPHSGGDTPQKFDGNTGSYFYLK